MEKNEGGWPRQRRNVAHMLLVRGTVLGACALVVAKQLALAAALGLDGVRILQSHIDWRTRKRNVRRQ